MDAILVCHDFTDHCNEATLRGANKGIPVWAGRYATSKIRGWDHFQEAREISVYGSKTESEKEMENGLPEGIDVIYVPTDKFNMAGIRLHGATIISFSLPSQDKRYSVVYSPHGTTASSLKSWISANPGVECLALLHGFDEIDNPWYLGKPSSLPLI